MERLSNDLLNTDADIDKIAKKYAKLDLKKEIKDGVQTIQYQINTFSSSNGQSPFVTIFMYIDEKKGYEKETALIIEEIIKQRIVGMKNPDGIWVTPAFPKLIYVLDENNVPKDSEYRYLTDLAVKCASKRMMPDFISGKKMKENYDGEVFACMGCRSFLSSWKDEKNKYKWYGRFNQGVVTLNLPDVALSSERDMAEFWKILDNRLELVKESLLVKHNLLKGTVSDVSPIHWQYGAIARLKKGETIDKMLYDGYSTISVGYIGLYEAVKYLTGKSHTEEQKLALEIMQYIKKKADDWKAETNIGFSPYGTPSESTTDRLTRTLVKRFGKVEGITDKGFLTNSYHICVTEEVDPFEKLKFESQFQNISSGGSVSYVEVANLKDNLTALSTLIDYMYDTIQYAEINTKSDYCRECGFDGEILLDDNYNWYCPSCGNRDTKKMDVVRRTCGYLGSNFWNEGRTKEIGNRYVHLDNKKL